MKEKNNNKKIYTIYNYYKNMEIPEDTRLVVRLGKVNNREYNIGYETDCVTIFIEVESCNEAEELFGNNITEEILYQAIDYNFQLVLEDSAIKQGKYLVLTFDKESDIIKLEKLIQPLFKDYK